MAANPNNEYKVFRYYEGLCTSDDFPKEIAKVLSLGVKYSSFKDEDNNVIQEPTILRDKNWDIVYPAPDSTLGIKDYSNMTEEEYKKKINNQVSKISNTVILKTETTPKVISDLNIDDLTVDNDSNKQSLTMYLQIFKPTYIADPEQYPLDCELDGITPLVITKDMYKDSFKTIASNEYRIYSLTDICKCETSIDETQGSIEMSNIDCDSFIQHINQIYGGSIPILSIPLNIGNSATIEIQSNQLSKIKQTSIELYDMIIRTLNNGDGIEPKEYNNLESVSIIISKINNSAKPYLWNLTGKRYLKTYTIVAGTEIDVPHMPINILTPEFYRDGIYVPLESSKYRSGDARIIFDSDIVFEESTDGLLVVRYQYNVSGNESITERKTILNNHYVLMRIFDNINDDCTGPAESVYNTQGVMVKSNSHVSPWTKLSWYRDFEEVMVDEIDADVNINQIHDGTLFVPIETPGLNADTKLRYWINCNNDRFSLIVMGNPSLDYQKERHLISACYCGRIDSFDNSINDTAGNFALFGSSSTEPCNTKLTIQKIEYPASTYTLTTTTITDKDKYDKFLSDYNEGIILRKITCSDTTFGEYNVVLKDGYFFNKEKWPRYIIVDDITGEPYTPLLPVFKKTFITDNGKSNTLVFTVQPEHQVVGPNKSIYVSFSSYQEKFNIVSGVTRDVFGNVVEVSKEDSFGINTSDGTTSIMMFHTRSKAYYQKHHMLFATTEEYMSKIMYGKSAYTGEYYADRIKVTHGNDGPRGTLNDMLVIDSASLYAMDELVINKDFKKDPNEYEETFIYFPITAPYSPLSDSPNARYGLAIKKEEREPVYTDENKSVNIAIDELKYYMSAHRIVDTDFVLPSKTNNGCNVYWRILDKENPFVSTPWNTTVWYGTEGQYTKSYSPIAINVINSIEYNGDTNNKMYPNGYSDNAGLPPIKVDASNNSLYCDYNTTDATTFTCTENTVDNISKLKIKGFKLNSDSFTGGNTPEKSYIGYGYISEEQYINYISEGIGANAYSQVIFKDSTTGIGGTNFEEVYNITNRPFTDKIDMTSAINAKMSGVSSGKVSIDFDIEVKDAKPEKYIIIYQIEKTKKQVGTKLVDVYVIKSFDILPLGKKRIDATSVDNKITRLVYNRASSDSNDKNPNDALRYPCSLIASVAYGQGVIKLEYDNGKVLETTPDASYISINVPYNSEVKINITPADNYNIDLEAEGYIITETVIKNGDIVTYPPEDNTETLKVCASNYLNIDKINNNGIRLYDAYTSANNQNEVTSIPGNNNSSGNGVCNNFRITYAFNKTT